MKKTVSELFSPDETYAYFMLTWASRGETPVSVAQRAQATMIALENAVPKTDSRYQHVVWADTKDKHGFDFVEVTSSVDELLAQAADETCVDDKGGLTGSVPMHGYLKRGGPDGDMLSSFQSSTGAPLAYVDNWVIVRFYPEFPIGSSEEAAQLFQSIVRIWQPDVATFEARRTAQQIDGSADTYGSYLAFVSPAALGAPPPVSSATTKKFGDGILLMANDWSVDGVRAVHNQLLAAGAPNGVPDPRIPQVVPQFPQA